MILAMSSFLLVFSLVCFTPVLWRGAVLPTAASNHNRGKEHHEKGQIYLSIDVCVRCTDTERAGVCGIYIFVSRRCSEINKKEWCAMRTECPAGSCWVRSSLLMVCIYIIFLFSSRVAEVIPRCILAVKTEKVG